MHHTSLSLSLSPPFSASFCLKCLSAPSVSLLPCCGMITQSCHSPSARDSATRLPLLNHSLTQEDFHRMKPLLTQVILRCRVASPASCVGVRIVHSMWAWVGACTRDVCQAHTTQPTPAAVKCANALSAGLSWQGTGTTCAHTYISRLVSHASPMLCMPALLFCFSRTHACTHARVCLGVPSNK